MPAHQMSDQAPSVCPLRSKWAIPITLVLAIIFYGRLVATEETLNKIAGQKVWVLDLRPMGWTHGDAIQFFQSLTAPGRTEYGTVRQRYSCVICVCSYADSLV